MALPYTEGEYIDYCIERVRRNDPEFNYFPANSAQLGDERTMNLAETLKSNTHVTTLDLEGCNIGDKGVIALAETFKKNSTIRSVYLHFNNTGDKGAIALAEALKVSESIIDLDFEGNSITIEGFDALVESVDHNYRITNLSMGRIGSLGTSLTEEWRLKEQHLKDLIERNKKFKNDSIQDLVDGKKLNQKQINAIKAHLKYENKETKEKFNKYCDKIKKDFSYSMNTHKDRISDASSIIADYSHIDDMESYSETITDSFFRGTLSEITDDTVKDFHKMMIFARELDETIKLPNNIVFISDALKSGMEFSQINKNLESIINNPKAKEFALANPKKLGYLMTLDERKFMQAMGILNHPKLGGFVRDNPDQIATLARVSNDPEKLLRVVHAIQTSPNIRSVSEIVKTSEEEYHKFIKPVKTTEIRRQR